MTDSPPPPAAPQPAAPAAPLSEADDKLWASLAHFGGLLYILPSLIIYLVLKDRTVKTRVEAKEALNWQITFLIGEVILWILSGILSAALFFTPVYGLAVFISFLPFIWWVVNAVFSILGGIKVQQGGSYRYPFSLRLIK
jgi:uncharacterized Tic20 family protein